MAWHRATRPKRTRHCGCVRSAARHAHYTAALAVHRNTRHSETRLVPLTELAERHTPKATHHTTRDTHHRRRHQQQQPRCNAQQATHPDLQLCTADLPSTAPRCASSRTTRPR
jgi:hypothetical protein